MRCGVNAAALLFQHKKRRHQRGNQKIKKGQTIKDKTTNNDLQNIKKRATGPSLK